MVLVGLKNPIIGDNRVFLFFTNLQKSICLLASVLDLSWPNVIIYLIKKSRSESNLIKMNNNMVKANKLEPP
jgi:hypothetical protein